MTTAPSAGADEGSGNALPIGTRLSEFEIERVIGEGGFGIVYLAFDHQLHRRVAIKEYLPGAYAVRRGDCTITARSEKNKDTFEAGLRSFLQEARLLAQFEHPALLKVLRFWEAHGTGYMAMPHYQGRTLRDILRSDPAFANEKNLKRLVRPLLEAVELMHAANCYHRDISPDNIIVQPNGMPVLLDFGAARRIIGNMTKALTVVLKDGYAPIEQYADDGGIAQGPWTDVYGLAALMYAAITGAPPQAAVARVYKDALKPLAELAPAGYGPEFLAGVDRGLAVRPEARPQSIAEFRNVLGISPRVDPEISVNLKPRTDDTQTVLMPRSGAATTGPKAAGEGGAAPARPTAKPATAPVRDMPAPAETPRVVVTGSPERRVGSRGTKPAIAAVVAVFVLGAVAIGFYLRAHDRPPAVASSTPATPQSPQPAPPPAAPAASSPPVAPVSAPPAVASATHDASSAPPPPSTDARTAPVPVKPSLEPPRGPSKAEQEKVAKAEAEKAQKEKAAKEKAEADRLAKEKAEADRLAKDKAKESERLAREQAAAKDKAAKDKSTPPVPTQDSRQPTTVATAPPSIPAPPEARPASAPSDADEKDLSDEARRLRAAADRGDAASAIALGKLYAAGKGAPRSDAEAARWFRKAADQGNAEGAHFLAVLYASGRGVAKDSTEAAKWYRKAADAGFALAQNNLGAMYAEGQGVAKDDAEAARWYRKAAEQGHANAQLNLGNAYALGQGVPKDDAEAVNWYRKAAEQGNARAQNNLAVALSKGQGVARDEAEAARWYRKAAEQGVASAQYNLAVVYADGRGVMKDESEAMQWYRKAAGQGYAPAVERLKTLSAGGK